MAHLRQLLLFAFLMVFATACTKEEVVPPTVSGSSIPGPLKNTSGGVIPGDNTSSGGNLGTSSPGVTNAEPGGDISDDGDDIADSEKKRKKRR